MDLFPGNAGGKRALSCLCFLDARSAAWTQTQVLIRWMDEDGKAWNVWVLATRAGDGGSRQHTQCIRTFKLHLHL